MNCTSTVSKIIGAAGQAFLSTGSTLSNTDFLAAMITSNLQWIEACQVIAEKSPGGSQGSYDHFASSSVGLLPLSHDLWLLKECEVGGLHCATWGLTCI